ncbi:toprim domain-containing protein [Blastococcus sp. KM273129]|nr:toprim domain-containing protein [Blastococcus sp. KM273129]
MMSLHKLTAGDGYTYLTRQVAAVDSTERGHVGLGDYYSRRGEFPGAWAGGGLAGLIGVSDGQPVGEEQMKALFGQGRHPDAHRLEREALAAGCSAEEARAAGALGHPFLIFAADSNGFPARCARRYAEFNAARGAELGAPIPTEERARIRSAMGRLMFAEAHGRPPADARELSGFIARASRPATTAVAGYDLTFSPVKSVSALWALASQDMAEQIEAAHAAAVADVLAWLEQHATFTRLGHGGVRQVETIGLVAAVFTHRESRAGDPDLHTHVAVSNKVQTHDGRWRALDGRVLHKAITAASERYNTRLETHMVGRLGVRFAARPDSEPGKRPVREIVGIDAGLLAAWSTRRRAIDVRRGELAADFQQDHGRPPTTVEAIVLAKQATLETRDPKHEPRSLADQRQAWRSEAVAVLGSPAALSRMMDDALFRPARGTTPRLTDGWVAAAAARVVDTVSAQRATWQVWHVAAEAERMVRAAAFAPEDVDAAVDRLTDAVLSPAWSVPLGEIDPVDEPPELRRGDGASVYTVAGARLYTSRAILDAEARLVTAAGQGGGRRADPGTVGLALLETSANGAELHPGQAQLVRELAGSGARLQLALAPAGAGKTTALATLARAWTADGGIVLGLAPSAAATAALRAGLGGHCDTLAKLVSCLDTGRLPDWAAGIGPRSLVVVDEAGMAGTLELARAVEYVLGRGGSLRLIGDDRQLASVAAGGVLRDIAATHGAATLTELVRFTDPAEAAATVALRDGDTIGLGFYLDHHRVHVGDLSTCADEAYAAWAADRARGLDALLLAPTRDLATQLNARARADRLADTASPVGPEVRLADGTAAGAGDAVITRSNDRTLRVTTTDWVKNGDRWTVTGVSSDGRVDVAHAVTGRRITLPAGYVREHVQLGYASTVHAAQGHTAEASHTVLSGTESRQLLYVALTRGRTANHLYLATVGDGDPHSVITPAAVCPPTATDLLTAILVRDGAQTSATTAGRAAAQPATLLAHAAARYTDALQFAADHTLGPQAGEELENAAERLHAGLTSAPAWPTLRARLALAALSGTNPLTALRDAAAGRELGSAADLAAVLDWRLHPQHPAAPAGGPLPWLPAVPAALADHPHWGPYLAARAEQVAGRADEVARAAGTWTAATAPGWAQPLLDTAPSPLRADLAVWRSALDIPDTERRPTGPQRPAAAERTHQRRLDRVLSTVLPSRGTSTWTALADGIDPRIRRDEHWPALADRLATADRAGLDAAGLMTALAAGRPLPDDLPAAALWWRLAPHLGPATIHAQACTPAPRPDWYPALLRQLPQESEGSALVDPAWPALVAAVSAAIRAGWDADELVATAATGLPGMLAAGAVIEALVFRVTALTDPAPVQTAEPLPNDLRPPEDAHLLPQPDAPVWISADDPLLADLPPEDTPDRDDASPPSQMAEPTFLTPDPFTAAGPGGADEADYLLEQHFWATAAVGRDRLIELNTQAAAFFTAHYSGSWAPGYMRERLGTDPARDSRFTVGYAPAGWTSLTDHLRRSGATDKELLAAGLASRASTGRLIDRFRDRLTFPIRDTDGAIRGFVARRNPAATDDGRTGPKYLNTPTTDLYRKSEHLLGLHEAQPGLAAGAALALVEGPLDAIALTLATDGRAVGVATLGTALTDQQADLLRPHIQAEGPGVLVATDNDAAGQQASERIFWLLTDRGDHPRRLALPDGLDPADLLYRDGASALRSAIDTAISLADAFLDAACFDRNPADLRATLRQVGAIITALPPSRWLAHIDRVTQTLGVPPGTVHNAVLGAERTTAPPHRSTTGPAQMSQLASPFEDRHRKGLPGRPPQATPTDLHHSR